MPGERLRGAEGPRNLLPRMHASNKPQDPRQAGLELSAGGHAEAVRGLWAGSLGRTVRCVPTRRTVSVESAGTVLYGKWRRGQHRRAAAEWRWLHVLPLCGLLVPAPVAWLRQGRRSLLVTAALPGRALDAFARQALAGGWLDELVAYACREVAPMVRRLHERGLVHRDLYWNHLFCEDPRRGTPPALLDVERVFAPRWLWRRWLVKDLASLLASCPAGVSLRAKLRFLRNYLGTLRGEQRLLAAIDDKAARIRRHVPKFG